MTIVSDPPRRIEANMFRNELVVDVEHVEKGSVVKLGQRGWNTLAYLFAFWGLVTLGESLPPAWLTAPVRRALQHSLDLGRFIVALS